jgi:ATP-dependent Clp endopeptidase proteolytic subunit ClpP
MKKLDVFNYSFTNEANDSIDIHIDGAIVDAETQQIMRDFWGDETSVSYKSFRDQLVNSKVKTINVYVNSTGGHIGDAMAIHDMLVDEQAKGKTVNTKGRGIIASAATFILMAGNSEMSANSFFMIHNASGGVWGDVDTIERYAATMRKFNNTIRDFYASSTGLRKEDVTKMMDAETWLTSTEAKNKGFVKNVTPSASFTNYIPSEDWSYNNKAILNQYNSFVKKHTEMNIGAFQKTLAAAKAESFKVVDNGFLLSEENLNNIELIIVQAETTAAALQTSETARQAQSEKLSAAELALATANASITSLEAEVARLGKADAGKPSVTVADGDPKNTGATGWDKYQTEIDAQAAKLRAIKNS